MLNHFKIRSPAISDPVTPTFGGISLCLAVLLQFQVAGSAVTVQNSALRLVVTQLQCFGVTAGSTLHVPCLE